MKLSIDNQDNYTLISIEEEILNSTMAPNLKSEFVIQRNKGVQNLILDLSGVKFVDSSGLSAILTAERLWKNDGTFILTGVAHENVKKLIKISRLDTVLTIIPTPQESIDYVLMGEIEKELESDGEE